MKHFVLKAPCGAIVEKRLASVAAFETYKTELTQNHVKDGPGCPACKPEKWTAHESSKRRVQLDRLA